MRAVKKRIRWPSYIKPWLRFGSLMNLFLGGNGMKSHPPVSGRGKRSMWLAILCRTLCTSWLFLITSLWKMCRENSWWRVYEMQTQAWDGNEQVALSSAKRTECARTFFELRQTATCGIWLAFTNVASGWGKKKKKAQTGGNASRKYVAIKECRLHPKQTGLCKTCRIGDRNVN